MEVSLSSLQRCVVAAGSTGIPNGDGQVELEQPHDPHDAQHLRRVGVAARVARRNHCLQVEHGDANGTNVKEKPTLDVGHRNFGRPVLPLSSQELALLGHHFDHGGELHVDIDEEHEVNNAIDEEERLCPVGCW